MKNFLTSIATLFASTPSGSHYAFYTSVSGRLFFVKAPPGTSLSNGPYAVLSFINDIDNDTFSENMVTVPLQISMYSGEESPQVVLDMDTNLSLMMKNRTWPLTDGQIVHSLRIQGDGPHNVPANTEAGTEEYWLYMTDYEVLINRAL